MQVQVERPLKGVATGVGNSGTGPNPKWPLSQEAAAFPLSWPQSEAILVTEGPWTTMPPRTMPMAGELSAPLTERELTYLHPNRKVPQLGQAWIKLSTDEGGRRANGKRVDQGIGVRIKKELPRMAEEEEKGRGLFKELHWFF